MDKNKGEKVQKKYQSFQLKALDLVSTPETNKTGYL